MIEAISDTTQSAIDMALRILGEGMRRIMAAFRTDL